MTAPKTVAPIPSGIALAVLLALGAAPLATLAQDADDSNASADAAPTPPGHEAMPTEPEERSASSDSVEPEVVERAADQTERERDTIVAEAVDAIERTEAALAALEGGDAEAALEALEAATGKLELVIARDPALALAPIAVDTRTQDLIAEVETVERLVERAETDLDDGRVQDARLLLSDLASEIVIRTTNLPLASYPDAIKAVAPLIDAGDTERARAELLLALDTLVEIEEVLPLPWLRAEALLAEAETLAESESRTSEQNATLAAHLAAARHELELAEALGYGTAGVYGPMYEQIDEIEERSGGGADGRGWFDRLRDQVDNLFS